MQIRNKNEHKNIWKQYQMFVLNKYIQNEKQKSMKIKIKMRKLIRNYRTWRADNS